MKRAAAVLAALALSAGLPAHAQPETGSLIDRNRGAVGTVTSESGAAARRVLNAYGRCVARNRQQRAEAVLALPLLSEEQDAAMRRFVGGEDRCLGNDVSELRSQNLTVLGAMAEWFILNRHADVGLGRIAPLSDSAAAEMSELSRSGFEAIATCIARSDPAAAFALVQATPATDEERAAINRLIPHLGPCLPRGSNTFNRSSLRAIVAAGLNRVLTVASASPAAASSERD